MEIKKHHCYHNSEPHYAHATYCVQYHFQTRQTIRYAHHFRHSTAGIILPVKKKSYIMQVFAADTAIIISLTAAEKMTFDICSGLGALLVHCYTIRTK